MPWDGLHKSGIKNAYNRAHLPCLKSDVTILYPCHLGHPTFAEVPLMNGTPLKVLPETIEQCLKGNYG